MPLIGIMIIGRHQDIERLSGTILKGNTFYKLVKPKIFVFKILITDWRHMNKLYLAGFGTG